MTCNNTVDFMRILQTTAHKTFRIDEKYVRNNQNEEI